jgi:hypothetical protein
VTAIGVDEPDDEITDPEETPRPEFESSVDADEVDEAELELEPAAEAAAVEAVVIGDDLPGMVCAPT